jgi:hypothetical protein
MTTPIDLGGPRARQAGVDVVDTPARLCRAVVENRAL